MIRSAWRLCRSQYVAEAFTGEGASRKGARFNSTGIKVVYTSENIALACLEVIVHLEDFPFTDFDLIECRFDEKLVKSIDRDSLPKDWRGVLSPRAQALGDAWIRSGASAILRIPSVIVPRECNYLLNPEHPDFKKIAIGQPEPFLIDERFIKA